MRAFLAGAQRAGYDVVPSSLTADVAVIWSVLWFGRMRENQKVYEHYRKQGKPEQTQASNVNKESPAEGQGEQAGCAARDANTDGAVNKDAWKHSRLERAIQKKGRPASTAAQQRNWPSLATETFQKHGREHERRGACNGEGLPHSR